MRRLFVLSWALLLPLLINAQDVVISEVLYNPSSGNERVKLTNTTGASVNVTNWWFCARISYRQLSSATVTVVNGSLNIPAAGSVTLEFTTPYLNNISSDLGLYTNSSFGSCGSMVDFVQWGGSFDFPAGRENVAVEACLWEDETFAPTAAAGEALFFDGANSGGSCSNCGNNGATVMTLVADLFNDQTTLPVQLVRFEVRRTSNMHLLEWSTSEERNTLGFTIERSPDARHFAEIATVPAAGNSDGIRHYRYEERALAWNNTYYRLRFDDQDGSSGYSPLRMVAGESGSSLVTVELLRNPARSGQIDLRVDNARPGIALSIGLMDATGRPVRVTELLPDLGSSTACLDVGALPPGWYVVAIQTPNESLPAIPVILQ
ncbi:MAG: lamin tail domain-containing protein [Saprospiraceae bacterium]|nr:lamin tail domain-containing protein [Saprospiraceae bacterium]